MAFETLGTRSIVTIVFGPFILFCAWNGGYLFFALVSSVVIFGMNEFYDLATQKISRPQKYLGIAAGIATCALLFFNRLDQVWLLFSVTLLIVLVFELFRNEISPILNVATTFMGLLYVGFLLSFLVLIRELPLSVAPNNVLAGQVVMMVFLCIWLCDTSAYLLGSRIGKHKLFERVSPNKTIEGTAAGFMFALLTAYVCQLVFLKELSVFNALFIGGICGSMGQVSDLLESLFKRDARVKDTSNLIPGHGGILDRFDSEILVAPVVYMYLRYVVV